MPFAPLHPPLPSDVESRATLYQQLKEEGRITPCLNRLERRHYVSGETVGAEVKGLAGLVKGQTYFEIGRYVGSGFAGQVYQAKPHNPDLSDGHPWVALKVLRPRPRWKELFRDALFRVCFQAPFAPRLRESALRAGLIWQELLRLAAAASFDQSNLIPRPLGYYWDSDLLSFVEIQEWVEGRAVRYEFDKEILLRWLGWPLSCPTTEMERKQAFMAHMVNLCHYLGATGLARQYEWYTLVSQANVLVRRDHSRPDLSEFIAVDWRPGLAVPFFLPLSPVHARLIWRGLGQGQWVHFDETELDRLETYLETMGEVVAPMRPLVPQLKADEAQYRAGMLSLWPVRPRFPTTYSQVQQATLDEWQKRDLVSATQVQVWQVNRGRFWFYFWLEHLPILGRFIVRWWGNERVRAHWYHLFSRRDYRQKVWRAYRARALLSWVDDERVSLAHAATLWQSLPRYWLESWSLSWLPRSLHRLGVDAAARRQWLLLHLVVPVQLLLWHEYRVNWLTNLIECESEQGLLPPETAQQLLEQVTTSRMAGFSRDLILTLGLEFFAKLIYALLAVYGVAAANWVPLLIALLGPVSPSGVVRTIYLLGQLGYDLPHISRQRDRRLLLARLSGLLIAPWRIWGNLCVPLTLAVYYPEMALFLSSHLAIKLARPIPVLGGRGSLLEYGLFMLVSNLPVALQQTFVTLIRTREPR